MPKLTYEDVLVALGAGIRKAEKRINGAPEDDAFIFDETQIIENMLGTAYVVCQNEITAVVQAALKVADDAPRITIFQGSKANERENSVRALGPQFDHKLSKVQVLWHLGNYFKHRDEWDPVTWDGANEWTSQAIKAAGLEPLSSGNLPVSSRPSVGVSCAGTLPSLRRLNSRAPSFALPAGVGTELKSLICRGRRKTDEQDRG